MFPGRSRTLACIGAAWMVAAAACARSNSPDAGGDTALARDLALVRLRDSSQRGAAGSAVGPTASTQSAGVAAVRSATAAPAASPPGDTAKHAVLASSAPAVTHIRSPSERKIARACASARKSDQQACLRAELARSDARMQRVYNTYLARLRSAPVSNGGGAPAIAKLRTSQRAWLVYRDQECRRRNRGKEGVLWARQRGACLAELATVRADELERLLRSGSR